MTSRDRSGPRPGQGRRGILGGAVLVAVGVAFLLQALNVPNAPAYLFLALGLAFGAAWYLGAHQYVYLVPAATLITLGLGLLIPTWLSLDGDLAAPIFLGALAIGFFIVFLVDPRRPVPVIPAALLALVALLTLFGMSNILPGWFQPMFVPLLFVALGLYLLIERRPT